jgi:hypothetical protein
MGWLLAGCFIVGWTWWARRKRRRAGLGEMTYAEEQQAMGVGAVVWIIVVLLIIGLSVR